MEMELTGILSLTGMIWGRSSKTVEEWWGLHGSQEYSE